MKTIIGLLVTVLLCGCVYEVPLDEKAELPVNPALAGTWQLIPDDGKPEDPDEQMRILPFSATEYVVITSPGEDELVFRAYPVRMDGMNLIQLEWLQADPGKDRYHVCRYKLQGESLQVQLLSSSVVSRGINSPAALHEALLANRNNPELFDSPGRYRKLED